VTLVGYALRFILILPAIILHEISHGWVANRLGDPTAKNAGRLSLNPVRHIDPWGTLLMPALLLLMSNGSFSFGYAKPVPINPRYFRDYRQGMFLTGIAGPVTNVVLALLAGIGVRLLGPAKIAPFVLALFTGSPLSLSQMSPTVIVGMVLWYFCFMNLVLVFFNLIPIPPLDGSRVLPLFLTDGGLRIYHQVEQYGFVILLALLFLVPYVFRVDPIGVYFSYTVYPLSQLFSGVTAIF
jgi:Zn-dependent protease